MTGKKRTTFAKLARESKLRERRQEKQARKDARKEAGGLQAIQADDLEGAPADDLQSTEPGQPPAPVNEDR
ncbi:MAG TPA: hypothetical protein VGF70_09670 [Solirubrobacteraceae bacterium]|jgi:hypothetical protein